MRIIFSNKGISLVEVMIAMFLTMIAVISILPMQDMSLRTASRSDYLGRAAGIMQAELETRENQIMTTPLGSAVSLAPVLNKPVTVSDLVGVAGDVTFLVNITTTPRAGNNSWLVNVTVTWAGNNNGITSSIIVTNQPNFR